MGPPGAVAAPALRGRVAHPLLGGRLLEGQLLGGGGLAGGRLGGAAWVVTAARIRRGGGAGSAAGGVWPG